MRTLSLNLLRYTFVKPPRLLMLEKVKKVMFALHLVERLQEIISFHTTQQTHSWYWYW